MRAILAMGCNGNSGVAKWCSNRGNDNKANSGCGLKVRQVALYSPLMPFSMLFVVLALQVAKVSLSTLTKFYKSSFIVVLNALMRYAYTS
jgi:hypothetical protein